jgi:hypothetical protein
MRRRWVDTDRRALPRFGRTGTNEKICLHRLDSGVFVRELDEDAVLIHLYFCRRDSSLNCAAERREMVFEDPLGLVLREAALESTATVNALKACGA